MEKLREFAYKYLAHFLAIGSLALIGFLVAIANAQAAQDERDRAQDDHISWMNSQIELMRKENREDHNRIEARLNELLKRP